MSPPSPALPLALDGWHLEDPFSGAAYPVDVRVEAPGEEVAAAGGRVQTVARWRGPFGEVAGPPVAYATVRSAVDSGAFQAVHGLTTALMARGFALAMLPPGTPLRSSFRPPVWGRPVLARLPVIDPIAPASGVPEAALLAFNGPARSGLGLLALQVGGALRAAVAGDREGLRAALRATAGVAAHLAAAV